MSGEEKYLYLLQCNFIVLIYIHKYEGEKYAKQQQKIRENYYQEDEGHWSDDDSIDEYEVDLSEEIRKDSH